MAPGVTQVLAFGSVTFLVFSRSSTTCMPGAPTSVSNAGWDASAAAPAC
jgi:hypothetical protein